MKKAKKIGLSLNKKVVSNFEKIKISGGTGNTCHCPTNTLPENSCSPTCVTYGTTRQNCTLGCGD